MVCQVMSHHIFLTVLNWTSFNKSKMSYSVEAHISMACDSIPFMVLGLRLHRKIPNFPWRSSKGTRPTRPLRTDLGSPSPRSTSSTYRVLDSGCWKHKHMYMYTIGQMQRLMVYLYTWRQFNATLKNYLITKWQSILWLDEKKNLKKKTLDLWQVNNALSYM